ncbi:hypothetical protein ANO11243_076200 [Dothideomycetidae sp. 11243]|nr:hypothetical protein ANO11243_076200 [fungal sp. No.11243]
MSGHHARRRSLSGSVSVEIGHGDGGTGQRSDQQQIRQPSPHPSFFFLNALPPNPHFSYLSHSMLTRKAVYPPTWPDWLNGDSEAQRFARTHSLQFDGSTWGFVLFRTTAARTDDNAWDQALQKFKAYILYGLARDRIIRGKSDDDRPEQLVLLQLQNLIMTGPELENADDKTLFARTI